MKREDDFETRRQHLKSLSEKELEDKFWELCNRIVEPLVEMGKTHTSPAVERSVLLRMGFSSPEAKAIVDKVMELGLLGKGAGNVVYRLSGHKNMSIREAGLALSKGEFIDEVSGLFKGGEK